ncbi:MAG: fumarate hydratase [Spirochaetes bacterium]|nr:fumarate hydratase [Spirochaetota bacterium]MBN2770718.1 fumarate hydratase [Spirochaetota bacterium]
MRNIDYNEIVETVAHACVNSNIRLPECTMQYYRTALKRETDGRSQGIIDKYLQNVEIADKQSLPLCQDTGTAVFFVTIGVDVKITGGSTLLVSDAITEGVRKGYTEGYLRKSIVSDPLFDRKNSGDNTPPIIHINLCEEDILKIEYAPKGGGAENMSRLKMMTPADGDDGVVDFVVETVKNAGGNPCPPVVIGVGIGGNFERCAILAKKALFREEPHPDSRYAMLEKRILKAVNALGIGPQGFGGNVTAFDVHIEYEPCHIASLPVAVNINCHVHRHALINL